ncbi:MAG: WD40 repeat domain-containing protein [Planctomycetaceae bacterium]|nr:WD40 repeat domain-containing protein [Planctomycetaceae bacterium]
MSESAAFDPKQAHVVSEWKHERPMNACRIDPQGRYVFGGAQDAVVSRFQLSDGAKTDLTDGHLTWVRCLAFTKDGSHAVSGACDGKITWWETAAETPTPVRSIDAHKGWVRSMDGSPDGSIIATGGNDNAVRLWNAEDGSLIHELTGHEGHIYSVAFHPSAEFVLTGDLMGVVKQWDVATGAEVRTFDAKPLHSYNGGQGVDYGGVRSLAISPDGKFLAAGGLHEATNPFAGVNKPLVLLFDWETQEVTQKHTTDGVERGVIWRMRWLSDGSLMGVTSGKNEGVLLFWKPDAAGDYHRFKMPSNARDMDLHPDGIHVATAHFDSHVRITRLTAKVG